LDSYDIRLIAAESFIIVNGRNICGLDVAINAFNEKDISTKIILKILRMIICFESSAKYHAV